MGEGGYIVGILTEVRCDVFVILLTVNCDMKGMNGDETGPLSSPSYSK